MTKRMLSLVMGLAVAFTSCISCSAETAQIYKKTGSEAFETVYIPYESEWDYDWRITIKARYKDTKEPITLSEVYDGRLYATVPSENADREIEAFEAEQLDFTDDNESDYEFYVFRQLSKTGVIQGNDKGEAIPFENITRAEAAAMLMRLLGLENVPKANAAVNFEDVSKNDWFYSTVMSAYDCGIVEGDSDTAFSPNRYITREEFTAMAARAVRYAGLGYPGDDNMNAADADKISDWAKEAFSMLGDYVNTDYDDTDPENTITIIAPYKNATRYDVAELLYNISDRCTVYPSALAEQFGFDKAMPVIDGSTSTYPFTQAVYGTLFSNGYNHPSKPKKHSKSHATYQRLINGEIDMMFASVYPANDILEMAEEKGVELELIPIAYDAMIFFTNADNSIEGLTSEQISNIYVNNAYDNWNEIGGPDALLYPYCRNNDSGSHAQMEKHFLNGNEIHADIRAESTSNEMASVLTDVIDAETTDPAGYALGYSIYYYYHNADAVLDTKRHLKLLAVDGVQPNDDTIADGSYPLSNNTYIVLRKDTPTDAPARKMAEFMLTEAGQRCVEAAGFGKLKPSINDLNFSDKLNLQMPADENYMFSPISVKMALALAVNGASGETKTEIANALGYEANIDEGIENLNAFAKDLIERYSGTENLKLNIANSIWINGSKTKQNFSSGFKALAEEYYNADVKSVSEQNAVSEINAWVSEKTNEKITKIVDDPDFYAMLVNAIYFKGAWQDEFSKGTTKPDEFTSADGTKSKIDFMNKTAWMNSFTTMSGIQAVELPYDNTFDIASEDGKYLGSERFDDLDVSMYLIMSDRNLNVEETLNEIISNKLFSRGYISLSMPKFKIEYEASLNDVLKNMGINKAFDADSAEFEKMFDSGNMWFTDTLHKTYIDVDEEGTEAAGVTAILMAGSTASLEPIKVKFNKPFYFVIRDNTSGELLFMGRFAYAE